VTIEAEQALIADGDGVSVTAKIAQHVRRSAKRGFGIDHPIMLSQRNDAATAGERNLEVICAFRFAQDDGFVAGLDEKHPKQVNAMGLPSVAKATVMVMVMDGLKAVPFKKVTGSRDDNAASFGSLYNQALRRRPAEPRIAR
jgi:hypothetical protein